MSGFLLTTFQYSSTAEAAAGNCAGNAPPPQNTVALMHMPASRHRRRAKGLGDLTTLGDDLAAANIAAVTMDLLPVAAVGVLAFIAFNKLTGAAEKRRRSERSAALKQLTSEFELKKKSIEAKYPTKRRKK